MIETALQKANSTLMHCIIGKAIMNSRYSAERLWTFINNLSNGSRLLHFLSFAGDINTFASRPSCDRLLLPMN